MLKITAHLLSGFTHAAHNNGINLDALLTWAYAKKHNLPNSFEPVLDIPLEVAFTTSKGLPVFSCSRLFVDEHEKHVMYRHKRNVLKREILCDKPLSKIEMATGQYKDSRIAHSITIPFNQTVYWWAKGDPQEIYELLSLITHLGKHRAIYGRVLNWTVEANHADFDLTPHMVIPCQCIESDRPTRLQTFTPPYWHRAQQGFCYVAI
jgi:CRISPR type IV-associated protein Csf3